MPDHNSTHSTFDGVSFEQYINSLYHALGYNTTPNVNLHGQQVDIVADKVQLGIGLTRVAIECKFRSSGVIGNNVVQDFATSVHSLVNRGDVAMGVMVTNFGYSSDARAVVDGDPIVRLLTVRDLEDNLFGLSEAYQEYIHTYKEQEIFSLYVSPQGTVYHGQIDLNSGQRKRDVHQTLKKWLTSSSAGPFFVLGDFGAGKTTLVDRLKYEFAVDYLKGQSKLKPLIILLRDYVHSAPLDTLLKYTLQREFGRPIPLNMFWSALENGEILPLIDGLDEMVPSADQHRRQDLLLELSPLLLGGPNAIITSRPSFFTSLQEFNEAIEAANQRHALMTATWNEIPRRRIHKGRTLAIQFQTSLYTRLLGHPPKTIMPPGPQKVVVIGTMDISQIDEFLQKYENDFRTLFNTTPLEIRKRLEEIYDLADLMSRPILLKMIVETVLMGGVDLFSSSRDIGGSCLYEAYTWMKLEADWDKGIVRQQVLTREERRIFSQAVALAMYCNGILEVTYDQVLKLVSDPSVNIESLATRLEIFTSDELATDIGTCTFLTWGNDSKFRFIHKSFMEFFVARQIKVAMDSDIKEKVLATPLTKEILYFLGGFAMVEPNHRQSLVNWLYHKKPPENDNETFRRNLACALLYSGAFQQGLKLDSVCVSEIDVRKTTFERLLLNGTLFEDVQWNHITDHESSFKGVRFHKCSLCEWTTENSTLHFTLQDCAIGPWKCSSSSANLGAFRSSLASCEFHNARINLQLCDSVFSSGSSKKNTCELILEGGRFDGHSWTDSSIKAIGGTEQYQSTNFRGGIFNTCRWTGGSFFIGGRLRLTNCDLTDTNLNYGDEGHITFEKCKFNRCWIARPSKSEFSLTLSECQLKTSVILCLTLSYEDFIKCKIIDCIGLLRIDGAVSLFDRLETQCAKFGESLLLLNASSYPTGRKGIDELLSALNTTSNIDDARQLTNDYIKRIKAKTWRKTY